MKLKLFAAVNLFFFFVVVVSIVTAGFVLREMKKGNLFGQNSTKLAEGQASGAAGEQLTLSSEEIAKHNVSGDCWIIIESKVYDVTGFISSHPGGGALIIPYCGIDASEAFRTKDKNPPVDHTQFANGLLNNYFIGNIGESINGNIIERAASLPTQSQVVLNPLSGIIPEQTKQNLLATDQTGVMLTSGEVATHNTLRNCWIIISGNVYNVTSYIAVHPGGTAEITNNCGRDATNAFQTKGGGGSNHSQSAYSLLSQFLIGSVGTSVSVNTPVTQNTNTSGNVPLSINEKYPGAVVISQSSEDDGRIEMKINYNGSCIKIKLNTSGQISEEEGC